jgi:hypothetical protein
MLQSLISSFWRREDGVVTVEWVALAGAVVVGAIAIGWIVLNSLQAPASVTGSNLSACESTAAAGSGDTSGCQ